MEKWSFPSWSSGTWPGRENNYGKFIPAQASLQLKLAASSLDFKHVLGFYHNKVAHTACSLQEIWKLILAILKYYGLLCICNLTVRAHGPRPFTVHASVAWITISLSHTAFIPITTLTEMKNYRSATRLGLKCANLMEMVIICRLIISFKIGVFSCY